MNRRIAWGMLTVLIVILIALFSIEESRTFLVAFIMRIFLFVKKNILTLLAAFFLVKGKFILMIFLKKVALLSVTGLGKRYLIEKVINHHLKIHFLDNIAGDMKRLIQYTKKNFKDFPIVKQLVAGIAFLASLSFVGKFMGGILAMKVFIAKFWSFILALVLKFSTGIVYFFTDFLWNAWFAPIVEVLIFSWLLDWMEKVPFLKKYLTKIYQFFITFFAFLEAFIERVFHIPLKRFLTFLTIHIKKYIYHFIGYNNVSAWKRLQEVRALTPNSYHRIKLKRKKYVEKKNDSEYLPTYKKLAQKRKSKR